MSYSDKLGLISYIFFTFYFSIDISSSFTNSYDISHIFCRIAIGNLQSIIYDGFALS